MSAIFISHSSRDNDAAASLRDTLERAGYRSVFLDFHPEDGIPAGRNWEAELYANLRACQAVVVLCSEHSMSSKWCFAEITHAKALGKELFPVRIGPCSIDPILTSYQVLDLTGSSGRTYDDLVRGFVAAKLDPASAAGLRPGRSPYPGLLAFEEEDAAVFFGRDAEVQEGLDLLNQVRRFSGARSVVLLGASGSGKSSVLKAGMLPRLRLKRDDWLIVEPFRPRGRPFQEMAIAIAASVKRYGEAADWRLLRDDLERQPETALADCLMSLRVASRADTATVLLSIDQAEELLAGRAERFLGAIAAALANTDVPAAVLFTLRSDFFAPFQRVAAAVDLVMRPAPIGPMPLQRLPRIIEGPAERAGIPVEPELTRQIVEDAGPHSLPLVAFALRELYEARTSPGRPLSLQDYRDRLGGLEGAIARRAEAVFTATPMSERQLDDVRRAFLRMVRLNEQDQFTRAPLLEREIPDAIRPILERFVQARLLVARGDEESDAAMEMAHEALIRSWERLRTWSAEDRNFLRWRGRLAASIAEWERTPDALLRGMALSEASEMFTARARELTDRERRFIEASRDAHEQEQLRWRRAYETALSRQLAAQAEQMRAQPNMIERSVLLATEAMRRQPGAEADLTLRRGLTLLPEPVLRVRLTGNLRSIDLSADGRMLVVGGEDGVVRLLVCATGEEVWRLRHSGAVYAVAFSPDGQLVASGSEATGDQAAWISRADTGARVATLGVPGSAVMLRFTPDGRYVVTAPGTSISSPPRPLDPFARVWDAASGRPVAALECGANPMALAFSDNARLLAVRDEKGAVRVFDLDTGALKVQMTATSAVAPMAGKYIMGSGCVAFSHDGRRLAGADGSSGLALWSAETGAVESLVGHSASVLSVDFSRDDALLALAGSDGTARVWQLREGRDIVLVKHGADVRGVRFLRDGRLATFSRDGTVSVWTARDGKVVKDNGRELLRVAHDESVTGIGTNSDDTLLASASWDGTVRVVRLQAGLHRQRFPHHREVNDIAFSPDSMVIATAGTQKIALWDAVSGELLHVLDDKRLGERVVFSRDQRYLGAVGNHTIVWTYSDRRMCFELPEPASCNAMAFSPDGARVATGGTDGAVHVWEIGSATELFSVPVEREVLALAFSPDGRRIAASTGYRYTFHQTAKTDPRVYLIDVEAGKRIGELPYRAHVVDLAFGPDGRRLLTASWDRSARVWDVEGLNQVGSISHDAGVTAVAFSPAGGCIATASDGAAMIWNADTREKLARIPDPMGATDSPTRTAVTFNHDGTLVATAMGSSGYIWTWRPEDLVAEACRKLSRDLTVEEWPHYLGDEPYRRTRELDPIAQTAE